MKKNILTLALLLPVFHTAFSTLAAQDTLWVRYDDRFKANQFIKLQDVDSIEFRAQQLRLYNNSALGYINKATNTLVPTDAADMQFTDPGRYLLKPDTYGGTDYTNARATAGYNFAHSMESDHFAVFWDARFGDNPKYIKHPDNGSVANANDVINVCERCWSKYVELGFVVPGKSTTDKWKIQLYIPYQSEWRADASGTNGVGGGKTGIGHFNPWAATARGGHTIAHEVGHTFQYLTSADLGMNHGLNYGYGAGASGGNGWWESCANWQAYKVFPERQFTDGEYFEGHLPLHHLNLLHEGWRYENCFVHDWWCMKHGKDFIGRIWRESNKPEDPIEAYMRLCGLTLDEFADEQMEGFMRMATWDIDGVRDAAKHRIGQHRTYLTQVSGTKDTWQSDVDHCIQNFGYSIINMNVPKAGTEVTAHFEGIAGADGWRKVNVSKAGWRYAFVAYTSKGARVYGDIQKDKTGTATLTIPASCTRLFFVVMGAPTEYWRHPWDDDSNNDEQWPFRVRFENTNLLGK
ncbi:MAG: hypothetical protein J6I36_02585 [Bacteroidaceae bacterium]|nr:hypothetical protein [Bacteroidaceae bacterium]